jgi:hypothetical protein
MHVASCEIHSFRSNEVSSECKTIVVGWLDAHRSQASSSWPFCLQRAEDRLFPIRSIGVHSIVPIRRGEAPSCSRMDEEKEDVHAIG